MDAIATARPRPGRQTILLGAILAVAAVFSGIGPAHAQDAASPPAASATAGPASPVPGPTMCESANDLRLYIGFLREQSLAEDGVVPILIAVAASIYEAERLLGLVDATYRPLVEELVVSLQELSTSLREIRQQGTIGSGLAQLGESITRLGLAMDALSVALQEPCPVASSPAPTVGPVASPAA